MPGSVSDKYAHTPTTTTTTTTTTQLPSIASTTYTKKLRRCAVDGNLDITTIFHSVRKTLSTCSAAPATPWFMRYSQNLLYPLACGTRSTTPPLYAVLATLPLPCMRYSQHYPSRVCGTRNTTPPLYAVLATLLPLVCGTRNIVLGGTRHTTYSCDVLRYSRHFSVVMRHSQLYSFHVLFSGSRGT